MEHILTISDHSPENNKDSTWYGRKIQDLESKIHKLSERLTISNKPALEAAEGGMNTNREVQSLENGGTGNVRMEVEAPRSGQHTVNF